jgi:CTP-dependent riboflavin kinase
VLPDGSIINEINYSYSDSSQYLITITAGPKYLTSGSFQDSQYQLQSEEVTREGTVVQDLGNGAEYVVRVEGNIGEKNALSMILDEISVGDKVSVRIFNNPVEHR